MRPHLLVLCAAALGASVLATPSAASSGCELAGPFRIYSATLYFDAGGASAVSASLAPKSGNVGAATRDLVIKGSRWQFGSSKGSLKVSAVTAADWKRWGVAAYGPTRKVVFNGWAKGVASGPIEGSGSNVDFFWLIYRATPPVVSSPGTVWAKFGHSVVPDSC